MPNEKPNFYETLRADNPLASSGSGSPRAESVRPGAVIRAAYETLDRWFDSKASKSANLSVLNQIRGSHAALAWALGIATIGFPFDENLTALRRDIAQSPPGRAKTIRTKKSKSKEAKTK